MSILDFLHALQETCIPIVLPLHNLSPHSSSQKHAVTWNTLTEIAGKSKGFMLVCDVEKDALESRCMMALLKVA